MRRSLWQGREGNRGVKKEFNQCSLVPKNKVSEMLVTSSLLDATGNLQVNSKKERHRSS